MVIQPGEDKRTESGGDVERNAEIEDIGFVEIKTARCIDATKGEQRGQAVHIEYPCDQEANDVGVFPDITHGVTQLQESVADARPKSFAGFLRVRREEEKRQCENGEPDRHEQETCTQVFTGFGIERTDARLLVDEQKHDGNQADQSTGVAETPAPAGPASEPLLFNKTGKHGVVEDDSQLQAERSDTGQQCSLPQEFFIRMDEPEQGGAQDAEQGKGQDPGFAPAGLVGGSTENRAEDRHQ